MSNSFAQNKEIISFYGLLEHSVCTIKPKEGAFGENQEWVNSLCKGVRPDTFYDIFSKFPVDEIKKKFSVINIENSSEIDWDRLQDKFNDYNEEKTLNTMKKNAGLS
ncbi:hypothetical protein [Acetobacter cerevisiae]|uniref:hypothetical protein n=1 Tax=Acetobacter cerevisiae TaxID=178900 RepID=UPI00078663FB|nr:hypothetical protein [Acetobacter cerevisiae]